jgi:CRISPR-associated exonuclease Cas4
MAIQEFSDDDLLMISGIQHIAFCERQWAFIHIEQQWSENVLTIEGHHLHEKVDDPFEKENRSDTSILRSLPLVSRKLGLYGIADVVELIKADIADTAGVEINGKTGKWLLLPVEYKRGKPKPDERDEVQLCAQAACLEEMYKTKIGKGYLYYGETRHRHEVPFTELLRQLVTNYATRMHELFSKSITPAPVFKPHCKLCSLKDICLPSSLADQSSASEYLKNALSD